MGRRVYRSSAPPSARKRASVRAKRTIQLKKAVDFAVARALRNAARSPRTQRTKVVELPIPAKVAAAANEDSELIQNNVIVVARKMH